jgi:hypothetical protein
MNVSAQRAGQLRSYVRVAVAALGEAVARPPFRDAWRRQSIGLKFGDARRRAVKRRATEFAKDLVRASAAQYGVPLPRLHLRFADSLQGAGQIMRKHDGWYMDLSTKFVEDHDALIAIVGHEFAHVALELARVRFDDLRRNEELTDTTAVLAGYGAVMRRSSIKTVTEGSMFGSRQVLRTLGYLTRDEIGFVWRIRSAIFSQQPILRLAPIYTGQSSPVPCPGCASPIETDVNLRGLCTLGCRICGLPQRVFAKPGVAPLSTAEELAQRTLSWVDARRTTLR